MNVVCRGCIRSIFLIISKFENIFLGPNYVLADLCGCALNITCDLIRLLENISCLVEADLSD